jgi:hypothetical protein
LGSVRGMDKSALLLESRQYEPYGATFDTTGTSQTDFGFTGEMTNSNNWQRVQQFFQQRYGQERISSCIKRDVLAWKPSNTYLPKRWSGSAMM